MCSAHGLHRQFHLKRKYISSHLYHERQELPTGRVFSTTSLVGSGIEKKRGAQIKDGVFLRTLGGLWVTCYSRIFKVILGWVIKEMLGSGTVSGTCWYHWY